MYLEQDAFASGQILSKIWLAETLEAVVKHQEITQPLKILLIGGWYGLTNLILRIRKNIKIENVVSIDIDKNANFVAEKINETWIWQNNSFKTVNSDANNYSYSADEFDLIINTSVEHIDSKEWFNNIHQGSLICLQSNDMDHEDHCGNHKSLSEFKQDFPLEEIFYEGVKSFQYTDKCFKRYMLIGKK